MNNDLISRSALLEKVRPEREKTDLMRADVYCRGYNNGLTMAEAIVIQAPAVDAVEVVRCKECIWFNKPGCSIHIVDDSDKPKENDFCSFGERKTDVENK